MIKYKKNNECLVCGGVRLSRYLDLGNQPLANLYHKNESDVLDIYPLQLDVCLDCYHSQLSVSVEPSEMFNDYLYVSDTTKTLTEYFKNTTQYIINNTHKDSTSVLEIACNSGLLLDMFQNKGYTCVGVDPAKNLRKLSLQRNLNVYVNYWNTEFSKHLKSNEGTFDIILAFHVLPHVPNPNDFINACKLILKPGGKIFIQTSQCDMLDNHEFDVIYHEHSSYFSARSIKKLARNHNMYVSSIIKTDIHGKSFLFSFQSEECDESQINKLIEMESTNYKYKYLDFSFTAEYTKYALREKLYFYKKEGYILGGYGAAAKGNTLLNFINFKLDFIIDDNVMKQGYLTPGMNIPIVSIDILKQYESNKICFIPLAWNFYDEIYDRIKNVRNNNSDIFIKYFPKIQIDT